MQLAWVNDTGNGQRICRSHRGAPWHHIPSHQTKWSLLWDNYNQQRRSTMAASRGTTSDLLDHSNGSSIKNMHTNCSFPPNTHLMCQDKIWPSLRIHPSESSLQRPLKGQEIVVSVDRLFQEDIPPPPPPSVHQYMTWKHFCMHCQVLSV